VSWNRFQTAEYMNCGDAQIRSDLFAFNDYSWCDPSSYTISGWNQKVAQFSNYSIPLFLSEYGCITNTRQFQEVAALYSTQMTPVYSGGLVYEYSQEPSNYGLVVINSDGTITERPDFTALQTAYQNTSNPSGNGGYNANGSPSTCPPAQPPEWVVGTTLIPTMPAGANTYLQNGAGTGPGLNGAGSQNSGTTFAFNATTGGTAGTTNGATTGSGTKKSAAVAVPVPFGGVVGLVGVGLMALMAL